VWSRIKETGDERKQLGGGVFQMWRKGTQIQGVSAMKGDGEEKSGESSTYGKATKSTAKEVKKSRGERGNELLCQIAV